MQEVKLILIPDYLKVHKETKIHERFTLQRCQLFHYNLINSL